MTDHPLYEPVSDLPGALVPSPDGAPWLVPAAVEELSAVVAAAHRPGARLQLKEDGAWLAAVVDASGRVASVTSRAGLYLRLAAAWKGAEAPALAGWTVVGEVLAGSLRAKRERAGTERYRDGYGCPCHYQGRPRVAVFWLLDPEGERHEARDVAELLPEGMAPVAEAAEGDDWGAWTREVLRAGGEGVVIRYADGTLWRAKGRLEAERVVHSTRLHRDRNGDLVPQLGLALAGRIRARRSVLQWVAVPAGCEAVRLRGKVVTVRGSALTEAGKLRDGRIVRIRPDKRAA